MSLVLDWMDGHPRLAWVTPLAVSAACYLWAHVMFWATRGLPAGTFDLTLVSITAYGPYALLALWIGRRVARNAITRFWPATGWPIERRGQWFDLFAYPGIRAEAIATVIGIGIGVGTFLGTPAALLPSNGDRVIAFLASAPLFFYGYAFAMHLVLAFARWARLVARMHREAAAVDIFDSSPLHAFSRLTAFIGVTILAVDYYSFTVNAGFQAGNVAAVAFAVLSTVLSVVAFIAPLWGIHDRIADERAQRLAEVERRIGALGARMIERVDAGEYAEGKAMTDSLAGLNLLRDRLVRLPTWPWPPQLLRGFVSALLLPVVVYLLTRLAGGLVGQ